ncbi:hypothetical protein EGK75_07885 [Neisseria weixii]|uniref:Uncharacterized protein n=1 Tax=Neisseria weixii TaxID=1853276 RepID=A0A3N4MZS7_9NEIS|nr:hypothetical protein EGK75_07885 [Neisseria weixii]RPD89281.1 hypothetical protein EGK74_04350 [Neisseria weixii]
MKCRLKNVSDGIFNEKWESNLSWGNYIYEVAQFHDGDAGVTITSSQTGKEIQQYECWDEMNMRLNRVSPHYFKPYTDEWESRLQRRFLK